jgi:hypothetical protein
MKTYSDGMTKLALLKIWRGVLILEIITFVFEASEKSVEFLFCLSRGGRLYLSTYKVFLRNRLPSLV